MIRGNNLSLVLLIYHVFQVYSQDRPSNHFQCKRNELEFIEDDRFCDGNLDCKDGSDEDYGCAMEQCGNGKFKCLNGTCLDISMHCNTAKDCIDGSDELKCGDEIDTKNCLTHNGKFLCNNREQCIDLSNACDGRCNCQDCTDESTTGCLNYDDYLCNKCSMQCDSIANISPDLSTFNISGTCKHCLEAAQCHQKCISIKNSNDLCFCNEHYYYKNYQNKSYSESGYSGRCLNSVSYENVIVYSTLYEVKLFNITANETIALRTVLNCTAVSAAHSYVFYATFVDNEAVIFKTSIKTKETTELIKPDSLVLSIAVDWITNNIYYTTKSLIWVCASNGKTCLKLKFCSECRIKVVPKAGVMYWVTKNDDYMMQSALDGSHQKRFVEFDLKEKYEKTTLSDILFAVDESRNRIVWVEHSGVYFWFKACRHTWLGFNSTDASIPYTKWLFNGFSTNGLFAIDFDLLDDVFFFTNKKKNSIMISNPLRSRSYTLQYLQFRKLFVDTTTPSINYIHAYNRIHQRTKISNPCAMVSCFLCLLRPAVGSHRRLNYTCKSENVTSTDDQFSYQAKTPVVMKQTEKSLLNIGLMIVAIIIAIGIGVYFTLRRRNLFSVLRSNGDLNEGLQLDDDF